jgi:hypothetical protein
MTESVQVEVRGDLLIVTQPETPFVAIYVKTGDEPRVALMRRSPTHDQALLAQACKAANDKALELGWIV